MKEKNESLSIALIGVVGILGLTIVAQRFLGVGQFAFFLYAMIIPLAGMFLNVKKSALYAGIFFVARWIFGIAPVTFGIPTACGAFNWSLYTNKSNSLSKSKIAILKFLINFLLPLFCVGLFVIHPVGSQASVYSSFWLIPVALYFINFFVPVSLFRVALGSVFISHAVGSVMWLYVLPTIPSKWVALMPLVAIERLTFAVGGVCVFMVASSLLKILKSLSFFKKKTVLSQHSC
ncbi:hypothetical protein KAH94_06020 [bacterium]|nr:hypothetical protein [bacterium]